MRTPTHITSEENLVYALKKRDQAALSAVYDLYVDAVYGIVYRIVGEDAVTEDLTQKIFLKIWEKIESYDPEKGRFFTWILNISRNAAIDFTRSKEYKQGRKVRDIQNSVDSIDQVKSSEMNVDLIGLKETVMELEPEYKIVVDLLYFRGYTQVEAAEELGIPLGTVKTRIKAAINQLRKWFA